MCNHVSILSMHVSIRWWLVWTNNSVSCCDGLLVGCCSIKIQYMGCCMKISIHEPQPQNQRETKRTIFSNIFASSLQHKLIQKKQESVGRWCTSDRSAGDESATAFVASQNTLHGSEQSEGFGGIWTSWTTFLLRFNSTHLWQVPNHKLNSCSK